MADGHPPLTPSRERILLWLLALTQFTLIMDFVMMMPLGPLIMRAFDIGPTAFAAAVSIYAWFAGLSGFFAATYIDRFDRKRLLLATFALFAIANASCALAPNFQLLLLARAFTGLAAGVVGAVILAIVGDLIPASRRGTAMGMVMTAFPMAMVAGVPVGVYLAAYFGWQATFFLLLALSTLLWIPATRIVPSLTGHLASGVAPLARVLPELFHLVTDRRHINAFLLTALVMTSGMMIIPFIPTMLVVNRGVQASELSWVYMAGGLATLFTAHFIGRMSDRHGKQRIFRIVATAAAVPMLFMTHFPPWPLIAAICLFPCFMVLVSGRNIPLQALQTTVPDPSRRGAFLSVNMAVQSVATGLGAWLGGLMVSIDASGAFVGFGNNGWVAAFLTCLAAAWVGRVRSAPAPAAVRAG